MTKQDIEKLASLYASDTFQTLKNLIAYKIQLNQNEKRSKDTFEKTALNIAKMEGGEEFGLSLLESIKRCYKQTKE